MATFKPEEMKQLQQGGNQVSQAILGSGPQCSLEPPNQNHVEPTIACFLSSSCLHRKLQLLSSPSGRPLRWPSPLTGQYRLVETLKKLLRVPVDNTFWMRMQMHLHPAEIRSQCITLDAACAGILRKYGTGSMRYMSRSGILDPKSFRGPLLHPQ